jgi:hypothetical protein
MEPRVMLSRGEGRRQCTENGGYGNINKEVVFRSAKTSSQHTFEKVMEIKLFATINL